MIYSGLDWSMGDDGAVLVLALVFVDANDLSTLDAELNNVRREIRKDENFVFKRNGAKTNALRSFYPSLLRVPSLTTYLLRLDTASWRNPFLELRIAKGEPLVSHAICTLVTLCPDALIADHVMLIDLPPKPKATIDAYRTALRDALKISRKPPIRDMRGRPDNRSDGAIVQAADMIAGEFRRDPLLQGPNLPRISSRIHIV